MARAVEWALREMKRLGLSNVRTVEAIVPHWERGDAEFAVLAPWPQSMPTLALGGSIGTDDRGIEADAVMVKDLAALAALPADAVRGKIVFFSNRMERTRDGSGYGRAVTVRSGGASAAAALGAVGVVIRSIGTSDQRFATASKTSTGSPYSRRRRVTKPAACSGRAGPFTAMLRIGTPIAPRRSLLFPCAGPAASKQPWLVSWMQ